MMHGVGVYLGVGTYMVYMGSHEHYVIDVTVRNVM